MFQHLNQLSPERAQSNDQLNRTEMEFCAKKSEEEGTSLDFEELTWEDLDDEEAKEQAKDQLISEGILEPTEQQINERANAIQESSATQVDVQESTPDSPEVGEGDAAGVVTQEGETQNQGVDKPIRV